MGMDDNDGSTESDLYEESKSFKRDVKRIAQKAYKAIQKDKVEDTDLHFCREFINRIIMITD